MPRRGLVLSLCFCASIPASRSAAALELWPGARHDPAIPTLAEVLGHEPGEEITSPEGITAYLRALHAAAPERTRLVEYARTWEGRPLHALAIASPERVARLDALTAELARFADPRRLDGARAAELRDSLPVVVWLMHAVHGNEISSPDAALATAHHLLAAQDDPEVDLVRREALVLIDPLQNPDGRARFLHQHLLGRAARPDAEPAAAEHDEPWPGGRSNHYLFDMNRDWFALTQPETRGRVALALEYFPHVAVDLHEMGGEATYYFAPPAPPENPHISAAQHRWFETFGRANAERFDARGFAYFIREIYDSFYPGYGESWPLFQGAVGMTYEQASARGLVYRRRDTSLLTYRQGVVQHATAALATAVTAARHRQAILDDYLAYRRAAVADGESGATREYLLVPGADASRAERLAGLLAAQGIEVRRASAPVKVGSRTLPAGTFLVAAAQPAGRLVRNLLDTHTPIAADFLAEQDRRRRLRLPDQIYDVTAWSLPLLFDVECVTTAAPVDVAAVAVGAAAPAASSLPAAKVGYLVPWGAAGAAAVNEALLAGLAGRAAGEPLELGGRRYAVGTALFRSADNGPDLAARLGEIAARHGAEVVAVDSGWVDRGISLGSGAMRALRAPRVLLAWDQPASSLSAGWARWVLERRYGFAVTAVRTASLGRVDLERYDALVLPSGDYGERLGEDGARRLRDWARRGGTLVTLAEASRWAAKGKAGLLETTTELRGGAPELADEGKEAPAKPAPASDPFDYEAAILPERERPEYTPGAILRVVLDGEHWLAAGTDGEIQALVDGRRVFTPIKLDAGRNVGVYADDERLVAAGVVWEEARRQLARKAYVIHQPLGDGHLVAFAEDPNFRGYAEATELLLANALLLGPAF
jgi:hypothetical protein